MSVEWKGVDSGGTEQLWDAELLFDILTVLKTHEPFSRNDPNSPIFEELENRHSNITWREQRADGTFNPIFRRANPMAKLGLTTNNAEAAMVTEFGNEVLHGELTMQDVFVKVAQNFRENDGENSLAKMCSAGLAMPDHEFRYADIQFGVAEKYNPEVGGLAEILAHVQSQGYEVASNTRRRRLRAVMRPLTNAGAFIKTKNGWILGSRERAEDIAGYNQSDIKERTNQTGNSRLKNRKKPNFEVADTGLRKIGTFDLSRIGKTDPVNSARALERSNQKHEDIVAMLGAEIKELKLDVYEDADSFDLAVFSTCPAIFEIKTISNKNVISQLRKAVVQLEEYRWRHQGHFENNPRLFIALNENPSGFLDELYFEFIEKDRYMTIIWPQERFCDRQGTALPALLTPLS